MKFMSMEYENIENEKHLHGNSTKMKYNDSEFLKTLFE
jgi:hypothetical protein